MEVAYLLIAWPASEIEPSTVLGDTGDLLTMHALISLQTPIIHSNLFMRQVGLCIVSRLTTSGAF